MTSNSYMIEMFENKNFKKVGEIMVEFDQYRYTLNTFTEPLQELRDSL